MMTDDEEWREEHVEIMQAREQERRRPEGLHSRVYNALTNQLLDPEMVAQGQQTEMVSLK